MTCIEQEEQLLEDGMDHKSCVHGHTRLVFHRHPRVGIGDLQKKLCNDKEGSGEFFKKK